MRSRKSEEELQGKELQGKELQGRDPSEQGSAAGGGSRLILVVEDQPAVRTLARRMLERSGFRVHTAGDGVEAMELLEREEEKVHLVLSDLEMPRMGGLEFFECLRERGMQIPFILASGYLNVAGLQEVSGKWKEELVHLQKPWSRAEILKAVNAALTRTAPNGKERGPTSGFTDP